VAAVFTHAGCGDDAKPSSDDTATGTDTAIADDTATGTDTAIADETATGTDTTTGTDTGTDTGDSTDTPVTTTITILHFSGEATALSPGERDLPPGAGGANVQFTGRVSGAAGVILVRPTTNSLDQVEPLAAPADGVNTFAVGAGNEGTFGEGGFRLTDAVDTMAYDDTYTLDVAAGLAKNSSVPQQTMLAIYADMGTAAAARIVTVKRTLVTLGPDGTFGDARLTFTVPGELHGRRLFVGAWVRSFASSVVYFDNFRLTRTRTSKTPPAPARVPNGSFELPDLPPGDYTDDALNWETQLVEFYYAGVVRHDATQSLPAPDGSQVLEVEQGGLARAVMPDVLVAGKSYVVTGRFHSRLSRIPPSLYALVLLDSSGELLALTEQVSNHTEWKTFSMCFTPNAVRGDVGQKWVIEFGVVNSDGDDVGRRLLIDSVDYQLVTSCE